MGVKQSVVPAAGGALVCNGCEYNNSSVGSRTRCLKAYASNLCQTTVRGTAPEAEWSGL